MTPLKPLRLGWQDLIRSPSAFCALGFGSGLSPIMPGTCGTLAALPLYFVIAQLPIYAYGVVLLLAFIVGVYICDKTAKELGVHDHGGIVWDEFVGLWLTLLAAPAGWAWVLAGFVLFRVFDMVKPWPISWADRKLSGGLGIMFDDILAGLAAWVCLQVVAVWWY